MPATQISFTAFALAAFADNTRSIAVPGGVDTQQVVSVVLCAPPVTQAASVLVAQPVAADGGECINVEAFMRRLQRARLVRNWRALPPSYGVEIGGCVVLYHSRARAFNQAARYSYARFVEVCQ